MTMNPQDQVFSSIPRDLQPLSTLPSVHRRTNPGSARGAADPSEQRSVGSVQEQLWLKERLGPRRIHRMVW